MKIEALKIGDLVARLPIIQGGMGIGVSRCKLASAVAKAGGIGVISAAQVGYDEKDFEKNNLEANLRALRKHIKEAKENSNNGIIGVNVMVATNNYAEHVKASVEAGVDLIISGAGLPTSLPKIVKGLGVKIAPIVSSLKSARVILKLWDKHDKIAPDLIVIEGARAGGHLGFKKDDIFSSMDNFDDEVVKIIEETKIYAEKYSKNIPVVVAGGVFDGKDIAKYLKLGANGVQMATRFVATEECDASEEFKNAYVNCKKEDIAIVSSPVGMPGRAIENEFVKKTYLGNIKVTRCYDCITHCNPKVTPYCISKALIEAVNGNTKEGLIFCGDNAHRINKIVPVQELMNELEKEILEA
ncbi:NAD(P)H-dependent flavin oxidoreductase YrpB, nitropropane dioxygenase family [Clostridium collagenovorans DSM 3089]|uniref:Probable nitronate monooxygenase n=1 Tax=Clostridium collagenovorans DSM 3089 TaxID=1121306 RepID=A0A1M5U380_9CLOT|nr:nitronate monooxygenase [Clostridium collagenovorans]SHH57321.1 NAD(P)H-dependent flavin oxidoreductase YrpB, nitropropane dioxygenase family [Clostridium collagenovorans DSM 3089]